MTTVGVKSVGTFPVILVKLATPPLPPQTKSNFEQMGGNGSFFSHNIAGEGMGGRQNEPKGDQKIFNRRRVLRTNNYL